MHIRRTCCCFPAETVPETSQADDAGLSAYREVYHLTAELKKSYQHQIVADANDIQNHKIEGGVWVNFSLDTGVNQIASAYAALVDLETRNSSDVELCLLIVCQTRESHLKDCHDPIKAAG